VRKGLAIFSKDTRGFTKQLEASKWTVGYGKQFDDLNCQSKRGAKIRVGLLLKSPAVKLKTPKASISTQK
jgi:hypothetical protein